MRPALRTTSAWLFMKRSSFKDPVPEKNDLHFSPRCADDHHRVAEHLGGSLDILVDEGHGVHRVAVVLAVFKHRDGIAARAGQCDGQGVAV
jgi:hypothetical protein